jgi:fatty-acyl-CoA synthase
MLLPTAADRPIRLADFTTLVEALDYAAGGETGLTLHSLRGELAEALSYRRLREEAIALAQRLYAAGLEPGDRVGLVAETDGDFARAFFACQYAGMIPAPLPLPAPLGGREPYVAQITRMLQAADAAALLGPANITAWMAETPRGDLRFVGALSDLPAAGAERPLPSITPEGPCYLQFSSGSTRFPMGVLVTHQAAMANAAAIVRHGLQVRPEDRAFSWLPLYHDMGLVGFLLSPLTCQMSVDLLPTGAFVRRPLLWLDLMARNGATISYSPSFGYELCARRVESGGGAAAFDLSRWRVAGLGGDMIRTHVPAEFARAFAEAGFSASAFVASYGMAEATLALSFAPLNRGLETETLDIDRLEDDQLAVEAQNGARARAFARCGPALPGHELQVRGERGELLPERAVGRVFARGPSLMRGYYRQPEETERVLSADGWLDTGDLGYLDRDEIVLTGRGKDLMIVNGRNIWPQDLEWTVESELEKIRSGDTAAFSAPAGEDEEQVVFLVQTRSSDPEVREALREEVARVLRLRHSVEADVRLVGAHALPQTSSGKLSRSKARAAFLAGEFDLEPTRS